MLLAFPTLSVPASCEQLRDAVMMCSRRSAALCLTWLLRAEPHSWYSDPSCANCCSLGGRNENAQERTPSTYCKPLERPGESSECLGCSSLGRWLNAGSQGSIFTMRGLLAVPIHRFRTVQNDEALRSQSWAHPCPFGWDGNPLHIS